jgi:rubredoxin
MKYNEESPGFCPMCDSGKTEYIHEDLYDAECENCGHEFNPAGG